MDPRSPYVISTHDLGRSPGTMSEVARTIPAPTDLATAVMQVVPGTELDLTVRLESVREGILATGVVRAVTHAECVRCLRDIDGELVVDVADLYFYPGAREAALAEGDEEAEDMRQLEGELLDLEPLLRDAIVTAMPFQPLCRRDCPGLCPGCGERFDDLPADHEHVDIDPRWAALAALAGDDATPDDDATSAAGDATAPEEDAADQGRLDR